MVKAFLRIREARRKRDNGFMGRNRLERGSPKLELKCTDHATFIRSVLDSIRLMWILISANNIYKLCLSCLTFFDHLVCASFIVSSLKMEKEALEQHKAVSCRTHPKRCVL